MDGFRASLQEEFDSIYVFNLRGNQRISGELSRKEGGKIFGSGSRTPIAITILVKNNPVNHINPVKKESGRIFYRDIGDYLSREKKLEIVKEMRSMLDEKMELVEIHPNAKNDWINQRDGLFDTLIPIGDKKDKTGQTAFEPKYSMGVASNRDAGVYNFSREELTVNMKKTIAFYNETLNKELIHDPQRISWSRALKRNFEKKVETKFDEGSIVCSMYRPFSKLSFYYDPIWNEMQLQIPRIFPTTKQKNRVICTPGNGASKEFSCLMMDSIPDLNVMNAGTQCFPLYVYEKVDAGAQLSLFDKGKEEYRQEIGITDFMLKRCQAEFGEKVTKEDIFYYIYGVLHSPEYRKRFESDLKKSLARIPLCKTGSEFAAFVRAGRKLGDLHCGYENVKPWKDCAVDVKGMQMNLTTEYTENTERTSSVYSVSSVVKASPYTVTKMRFAKKDSPEDENKNGKLERREREDRSRIIYNERVTIRGIPLAAYDYVVNGKSAIEWIMERYQVTTHKESGIVNDPNKYLEECGNERYIVELILKVVTVSMETQKIVSTLPKLEF